MNGAPGAGIRRYGLVKNPFLKIQDGLFIKSDELTNVIKEAVTETFLEFENFSGSSMEQI
jgi:hypothetical protein